MKKFIYSLSMAALFGIYVIAGRTVWKNTSGVDLTSTEQTSTAQATPNPTPILNTDDGSLDARGTTYITPTPAVTPVPTAKPTPAPTVKPTPVPTPTPKAQGQYADGTYTGSRADAYYGYVQVQATVSGGKLTNIAFLEYPSDRRESKEINQRALPDLKQEAIAAQSANVDIVSGATDSSNAFIESLTSALNQAKNG